MTFYAVQEEYALRALDATEGELIQVRVGSRNPGRFSYVEWDRELVDTYIRAAVALAWDNDEFEGYHLRMLTAADRYYWARLNRPPTGPAATEPDPAATEPDPAAEPE